MENQVPSFDSLMNPLLDALRELGGSGTIDEIYEKVIEITQLPHDVVCVIHNPDKSNQTEIGYRLAWARTYLKKYGLLENSSRGVWSLTSKAKEIETVDPAEVTRFMRESQRRERAQKEEGGKNKLEASLEYEAEQDEEWREELHHILTQRLEPAAFERLIQRVLRESGFIHVEVTGRTGDGGIDGKGIARIHGFMSFHVIFQCKKWKGSVGAGEIRDFRGAMVGRADKGLFITTGVFTPAAIKEATRDGAPPIDLVDGDQLAAKLKEFGLGVEREMVEQVTVRPEWFDQI